MMLVVPIFIVQEGCPHQCLFCNQHSITGEHQERTVDAEIVEETIQEWLGYSTGRQRVQVAFFGGSFSCLPQKRQQQLLDAVQPFSASGKVESVRISTRPDCISDTVCKNLYKNGVRTIELGCQSMDDKVLQRTRRGHTVEQSIIAAELVRKNRMELGIQLMVGLPGETTRSFQAGVRRVIDLQPDFVRLYPTLVVKKTQLASNYESGEYVPLTMNKAVALCCRAYSDFKKAGVRVIRMGLQASDSLENTIVDGPYHPAFGELVVSRLWFKRARRMISTCPIDKIMNIRISHRDLSAFLGPKRVNMNRLTELGLTGRFSLKTEKKLERGTLQYDLS